MHWVPLFGRFDETLVLERGQRAAQPALAGAGRRPPEIDGDSRRMHGVRVRVARLPARRPRGARHHEWCAARGDVLRRERKHELPSLFRRVGKAHTTRQLVRRVAGELHELSLRDCSVDLARCAIEGETMVHREVPHLLHALPRAAKLGRKTWPTLRMYRHGTRGAEERDKNVAEVHRMSRARKTRTMLHAIVKSRGDAIAHEATRRPVRAHAR
jgi:hypothetical protein